MTKVIILGPEPEKKELKPIEFTHFIDWNKNIVDTFSVPKSWKNIELICRYGSIDLMFAYDNDRNSGCLFIGHFNNGVVE